jgi:hypothetical protein
MPLRLSAYWMRALLGLIGRRGPGSGRRWPKPMPSRCGRLKKPSIMIRLRPSSRRMVEVPK